MGNKASSRANSDASSQASSSTARSLPQEALEHNNPDIKRFAEEALARIFTFAADDVKAIGNFSHVNQRWQALLHRQQQQGETPSPAMKLCDVMWRNLVVHSRPATIQRCPSGILKHSPGSSHRTTESTDPYQNSIRDVPASHSHRHSSHHSQTAKEQKYDDDFNDSHNPLPTVQKRKPSSSGRSLGSSVNSHPDSEEPEEMPDEVVKSGKKIGEDFVKLAKYPQTLWIIEKLVFRGKMDVNYRSVANMNTALISAVMAGNVTVVPTLVTVGARINRRGGHGATALLHACKKGDVTLARFLLDHGADPMVHDSLGNSCMLSALTSDSSAELLELLVNTKKFDINASTRAKGEKTSSRGPPLLEACRVGASEKTIKMLLRAKADPNVIDKSTGMPALLLAVKAGRTDLAKLLVDAGADVNASSNAGVTSLMSAAVTGDYESAKYLISKGAKMEVRDHNGDSAMSLAKKYKCPTIVDLLKESGAKDS